MSINHIDKINFTVLDSENPIESAIGQNPKLISPRLALSDGVGTPYYPERDQRTYSYDPEFWQVESAEPEVLTALKHFSLIELLLLSKKRKFLLNIVTFSSFGSRAVSDWQKQRIKSVYPQILISSEHDIESSQDVHIMPNSMRETTEETGGVLTALALQILSHQITDYETLSHSVPFKIAEPSHIRKGMLLLVRDGLLLSLAQEGIINHDQLDSYARQAIFWIANMQTVGSLGVPYGKIDFLIPELTYEFLHKLLNSFKQNDAIDIISAYIAIRMDTLPLEHSIRANTDSNTGIFAGCMFLTSSLVEELFSEILTQEEWLVMLESINDWLLIEATNATYANGGVSNQPPYSLRFMREKSLKIANNYLPLIFANLKDYLWAAQDYVPAGQEFNTVAFVQTLIELENYVREHLTADMVQANKNGEADLYEKVHRIDQRIIQILNHYQRNPGKIYKQKRKYTTSRGEEEIAQVSFTGTSRGKRLRQYFAYRKMVQGDE